jgi:hypothetical protein
MTSSPMTAAACSQYPLELLAHVPDPMIAGSRSFAAIGQWAAEAGPKVLAGLGAARGPAEESTFRRAFSLVSPDVLDRLLGARLHSTSTSRSYLPLRCLHR